MVIDGLPRYIEVNPEEISSYLLRGTVITPSNRNDIPSAFKKIIQDLELDSIAFLSIRNHKSLTSIVMLGARKRNLSTALVQPYSNLADLMSITLEKINAIKQTEKHLREMESLASINELISTTPDIQSFFKALLGKIQQIIGNYNMSVALYDEKSNTISIPFNYEDEKITAIESFPLGEGLTSILIRTRQPLMLVEDTEHKAPLDLGQRWLANLRAHGWAHLCSYRINPLAH